MAFNLDKAFQIDIAQMNLKKAHSLVFRLHGKPKMPFVIWLLENPNSIMALPGKISLLHHDYIHILLDRGISSQDEAFVIGFTMGNDLKTNQLHLFIYQFFAKFIYPVPYNFSRLDFMSFKLGFVYGRKIKIKQINEIDFEIYQNETIGFLRNFFGINTDESRLMQEY
ncbi:MAG: hypothetical protein RM022_032645 [Nostoc sp. EfeVER01]|uniref:hypothetical protein n=1 Tax=unclassified Nostoc TaxID=2593658 RepID=UPI002AD3E678|nr:MULTISPECIES: hypothetical protein [unclassified Nostoc]MDZ7943993.1 hypothetical protein [Nostoc sp. EfeVER01]MDZ7993999.1 hypothetical protein [Nostoc sp. EspVER01]